MKKLYIFLFILTFWFTGTTEVRSAGNPLLTFVISNECGLIDSMISSGYGSASLFYVTFDILGTFGGDFWKDFKEPFCGHEPKYKDIFKKLSDFAGLDSAIAINSDGSVHLISLKGKDFHNKTGYKTLPEILDVDGREIVTYAES